MKTVKRAPSLLWVATSSLLFLCACAPSKLSQLRLSGLEAPAPKSSPSPSPSSAPLILSVAKSGPGTVISAPAGIHCGVACSAAFAAGAVVTLTAIPSSGSVFIGWGGSCSGASPTCTLAIHSSRSVNATFESATNTGESIDALIAAMPPNSWKALPATQMKDACPLPYNYYACEYVIGAWSGGAYDDKRDRMIVYGGGHADSWYNNVFAFDLGTLKWSRLTELPAGATGKEAGSLLWDSWRLETCGFYPKGPFTLPPEILTATGYVMPDKCFAEPVLSLLDFQQPRSSHTYGGVFYDRVQDRYCSLSGSFYPSGQADSRVVSCFDPNTGLWTRIADRPETPTYARGQTALDAAGHVWAVAGEAGYLAEYDPILNAWKTYGYNNYDSGGGTDIDRKRNLLYVLRTETDGTHSLRRMDLSSSASLNASPNHAIVAASGDLPVSLGSRPGFVYVDALDRFFAWGGGRDLHVLDAATLVWKRVSAMGDDPGAQQRNGTFGRLRFSAKYGVFVLVNSTTQNVFIYKP